MASSDKAAWNKYDFNPHHMSQGHVMEHTVDTAADAPYWMATASRPKLKLPAGACDAHVHVFGPRARFPFAEGRSYTPPDAPRELLFRLHERLGVQHCVVVQPACHGFDNSVTADAATATGGSYKGVGLVPLTISKAELKRLDAAGLCGARFHYMRHLAAGPTIDEVIVFGKRLADIGWHLQIHMEAPLIAELAPALRQSPVPVVIDHMGRLDASLGLEQPAFKALLALLNDKNIWVKVSGSDRVTRQSPPYADAVPFARKLVAEFGDRCVWGTDWPHPNHPGPVPDDGVLVDILTEIAPSEAARQAILVDNPQRFYRFAPARRLTGAPS
jgi:2-pyrone-4,6-dicarboxylate lactonase